MASSRTCIKEYGQKTDFLFAKCLEMINITSSKKIVFIESVPLETSMEVSRTALGNFSNFQLIQCPKPKKNFCRRKNFAANIPLVTKKETF